MGHKTGKSSKNLSTSVNAVSGRCCCHSCCNCGGGRGSLAVWVLIACPGNKDRCCCRCLGRIAIAAEQAHQSVAWMLPKVVKNECSELTIRPKHQPRGQEGVVKVADNVLHVADNRNQVGVDANVPRRQLIDDDVLDELQIL